MGLHHILSRWSSWPAASSSGLQAYCKRKGWTGKRYEMEEVHDDFDPGIDYMEVTIGNRIYNCVKVILDGKCIYNNYDDEEEKNED